MNKKLANLMAEQVKKEMESAYLYYNIATYYQAKGLKGFASWFKKQAQEELEHADKFTNYLLDNDETLVLEDVTKVFFKDYKDLKEPLVHQLSHEKAVTASIVNLYEVAKEDKDYFSINFLNGFIAEQYEEEQTAKGLIEEYDLYGDTAHGLHHLDEKLAKRG